VFEFVLDGTADPTRYRAVVGFRESVRGCSVSENPTRIISTVSSTVTMR